MTSNYVFSHVPNYDRYKRVPCICQVRTANIAYKGNVFGTLSEERNDAGETDWVIKVDWDAWERLGHPSISGIDDIHKQDEYVRRFIPAIVEQRTPPDNRDNLRQELAELGLRYNDRFEFMCRTHGLCGPSPLTIERQIPETELIDKDKVLKLVESYNTEGSTHLTTPEVLDKIIVAVLAMQSESSEKSVGKLFVLNCVQDYFLELKRFHPSTAEVLNRIIEQIKNEA